MSDTPNYDLIRASLLGQELDEQESSTLATVMGIRQLSSGELLIDEGEADDTLFVLVDGKLAVTSHVDGREVTVYTMSNGECAGTRAFVDRSPRKATLRAVSNATVYTLKPDAFESLLTSHPLIVYKVMRALFRITHSNLMRMNKESQELTNYITKSGGRY